MNLVIPKKFVLSMLLVALIGPTVAFSQASGRSVVDKSKAILYIEDPSKMIDYIDNNKGIVTLDDFPYRLTLDTKVYDPRKTKLVNRYALKEGQRVLIELSEDGLGRYLESIYILG
jgi:hypothetical protein